MLGRPWSPSRRPGHGLPHSKSEFCRLSQKLAFKCRRALTEEKSWLKPQKTRRELLWRSRAQHSQSRANQASQSLRTRPREAKRSRGLRKRLPARLRDCQHVSLPGSPGRRRPYRRTGCSSMEFLARRKTLTASAHDIPRPPPAWPHITIPGGSGATGKLGLPADTSVFRAGAGRLSYKRS